MKFFIINSDKSGLEEVMMKYIRADMGKVYEAFAKSLYRSFYER